MLPAIRVDFGTVGAVALMFHFINSKTFRLMTRLWMFGNTQIILRVAHRRRLVAGARGAHTFGRLYHYQQRVCWSTIQIVSSSHNPTCQSMEHNLWLLAGLLSCHWGHMPECTYNFRQQDKRRNVNCAASAKDIFSLWCLVGTKFFGHSI